MSPDEDHGSRSREGLVRWSRDENPVGTYPRGPPTPPSCWDEHRDYHSVTHKANNMCTMFTYKTFTLYYLPL